MLLCAVQEHEANFLYSIQLCSEPQVPKSHGPMISTLSLPGMTSIAVSSMDPSASVAFYRKPRRRKDLNGQVDHQNVQKYQH